MSIFHKDCPQCASTNSASAIRCGCGYIFAEKVAEGTVSVTELAAQEERLYFEYLEARAIQATREAEVASTAAAADSDNTYLAAAALRAKQAANAARAELAAQTRRARAMGVTFTKAQHSSSNKPATPLSSGPVTAPRSDKPTPPKAAGAASKVRPIKAAPAAAPRAQMAPAPKQTTRPTEAFKTAQATKAKQVLSQHKQRAAPTPRARTATPSAPSTDPLQAARAALAARKPPVKENTKECPNCTAAVAEHIGRCRCGYEFPTNGGELPALSLDSAELDFLATGISMTPTGRTR